VLLLSAPSRAQDTGSYSFKVVGRIGPDVLSEPGKTPGLLAFDVSPDGSRIALLYATGRSSSGAPGADELGIATWNVVKQAVEGRAAIDVNSPDLKPAGDDRKDVRYSSDGRYLGVVGEDKIWALDAKTLSVLPGSPYAAPKAQHARAIQDVGEHGLAITYAGDDGRFHVSILDLPSGPAGANWASAAAPLSFSPDGTLFAAADPETANAKGVRNLLIGDARTGAKIRSLPAPFGFKDRLLGAPAVGISALFLTDRFIAVGSDGTRDGRGQLAAYAVEVMDATTGTVVAKMAPSNFEPTGLLVASGNRSRFVAENSYAKPFWMRVQSADHSHYEHEGLVLALDGTLVGRFVFPASKEDAGGAGGLSVTLRCSADVGIVAASAGGQEIAVLRIAKKRFMLE
jgi:hypothetical protein